MVKATKLTDFAGKAGISISYASQLMSDDPAKRRTPTVEMALAIYRKTGVKLGILSGADTREVNTLMRMAERTGAVAAG